MKRLLLPALMALGFSSSAMAIPTLQLGIIGGTYDPVSQTVIASGPSFTLYSTLIEDRSNLLADSYFLSMAVVPKTGPAPATLGSFTIGSSTAIINPNPETINITADMTFGTPPIETIASGVTQLADPGDLPSHGIFDTYFSELEFQFGGQTSTKFDTVDNVGATPGAGSFAGTGMFYELFQVNVSGVSDGFGIHFDLYNTKICGSTKGQCDANGDVDVTQFAPFSHDAGSGGGGGPPELPEPGTLALLGVALAGLGMMRRRFF